MTRKRFHGKLTIFDRELMRLEYLFDGSRCGGVRTYEKIDEKAGRRVDVQLWPDGNHRASNGLKTPVAHGWRWSTPPTEFNDIDGLSRALEFEWSRDDHPAAWATRS